MELRIRCAICDKLVDRVYWRYDQMKGETLIEVDCHGDKDRTTIADYDIIAMTHAQLHELNSSVGVAFTTPRISSKEKAPDLSDRG